MLSNSKKFSILFRKGKDIFYVVLGEETPKLK